MERRDVFENWFRHVNRDIDPSSFGRNQMDVEFESSPNLTGHRASERMTSTNRGKVRDITASTCQRLADIIGGEVISAAPVCTVMRLRNINATILGRRTRSPLALPFMLSFENNGLNLGESVVLQKELNRAIAALRKRGLIVTAFHNHWLFENPRLMYIHWDNVGMSAEEFARNSMAAAREAGLSYR
ncbi:DUF1259 domain-containing protein [Heyndrickxia sporothermodurans]|uniref:DUF1259 domain-containing protein n=1 Tax=Heyndrickxia sporothermodurans TaxID=46224 RepID=UPI002E251D14|nr:DUF1259 domain-containing protein [Heyndrickxia sporothermodurans]